MTPIGWIFQLLGYIRNVARKRTYSWAYGVEEWLSSPASRDGLRYARRLAETAREHSKAALVGEPPPFPLTPADLAFEEGVSESTVRRKIALARRELYSGLSDSAIYYRKARAKELARRPVRTCQAPDCEESLPRRASARREYCHSRCRRRHYYQRHHPSAQIAPHLRGARVRPRPTPPAQVEPVLVFLRSHGGES
jgi:hypothetical protein